MRFPDLPFLQTFVAIYELGGLTAASAQLHRTQPTLSYQLAQLEGALGARLFARSGRQLTPTALATQLYRLATGFARDLEVVRHWGETTALDLASVSAFGRYVLFPLLRRLERTRLTLRFPSADEVVRRVADGEVDAGFTYRAVARPSLVLEPVHTEHLVLVANHTWARRLTTPKQFRDVPVVTYDESEYVIGRWLGHHFGRRAPGWASVAHLEELEEVLALVHQGAGVSMVPSSVLAHRPRLVVIGWGRPPAENTVSLVRRLRAPAHQALDRVVASLRAGSRTLDGGV